MEFQMSVAHHHFHSAMVYLELMDTQVLIALLHLSQPVVKNMEDFQDKTVLLEPVQHHQVLQELLQHHQLLFKEKKNLKSQHAPTDTL